MTYDNLHFFSKRLIVCAPFSNWSEVLINDVKASGIRLIDNAIDSYTLDHPTQILRPGHPLNSKWVFFFFFFPSSFSRFFGHLLFFAAHYNLVARRGYWSRRVVSQSFGTIWLTTQLTLGHIYSYIIESHEWYTNNDIEHSSTQDSPFPFRSLDQVMTEFWVKHWVNPCILWGVRKESPSKQQKQYQIVLLTL